MSNLPAGLGASVETPQRMIIDHPKTKTPLINKQTGEPAYIDVYSSDSEIAQKHRRATGNKRLSRRNKNAPITMEELDDGGAALLAALTAGWSLATLDGDPIPDFACTPENAKALYAAPEMQWLTRQVDEHSGEVANFVKDSSTS